MNDPYLNNWCTLPTPMGDFRIYDTGDEALRVICLGNLREQGSQPLLRLHSSCLASEVFGAMDCDCADQLRESMKRIAQEGRGLIIHLHQEGRGHGLSAKIRAVHAMQHSGLDTVEAFDALGLEQDTRSYRKAVGLLRALDIAAVRLISNNPAKACYLQQDGLHVEMVGTHPTIRPENAEYLRTKKTKLGHRLQLDPIDAGTHAIYFYHSDQPWGELSNFSGHAVYLCGKVWPTVEHFYQGQKFAGSEHEESIRCCWTPTLAKMRAGELRARQRPDWATVQEEVMLAGLRAKFGQHPDLRERLLASGERVLVEHTERDGYWGDAGDGTGQNRLGHLLMRVRAELRADGRPGGAS